MMGLIDGLAGKSGLVWAGEAASIRLTGIPKAD